MILKKTFAVLPLALATLTATAQTQPVDTSSTFQFATQVTRSVDKDVMQAELYSRKSGKNLNELKKQVSANINQIVDLVKQDKSIEFSANGINNYPEYDSKGKVTGWITESRIQLSSKNFEAMAAILENLGNDIAVGYIDFRVSPEKMASIEDEMTLEIIRQFEHKAEVIKKGINAKNYVISNIQLSTPNGDNYYHTRPVAFQASSYSSKSNNEMPLEAGKATISAQASGQVKFEK
ncbi:SIMPL domain-containing protein [Glaesserella sp.]|uniref:SIMPL domain-containing protein n=2 Tax=Glaesserella sp. TaxID=2094731 RepID=UPI0035A16998